jgi:hypothetical protein
MVGYVELGTDSWIGKITGSILQNANYGLLLFIYTSGLMFILRFFGGPIEHRLSPLGLLCVSAVLGCIGLTLLGNAQGIVLCIVAATVYALGKTFLWPTMLAVGSERFPKGGAITIGMLGGVGALSAGLLGSPGIGFKQDYYASQQLQEQSPPTFERYVAPTENTFLVVFRSKGLDGRKTNFLELDGKITKLLKEMSDPETSPQKRADLGPELRQLVKERDAALKDQELAQWWNSYGAPNRAEDREPVEEAGLFGGRMALLLTAAVPATMAVLYLLLILYFRARGGYKVEKVVHHAGEAADTAAWMERIDGPLSAEPPSEQVKRPDTDVKR